MMKRLCLITIVSLAAACGGKHKTSGTGPGTGGTGAGTGSGETEMTPDAAAEAMATPDAAPARDEKADLLAAETAGYENAKPVFDKYCSGCHSKDGKKATAKKLDHFNITTYPFGGHHVATMATTLRHVLGIDGAKPSMPYDNKGAVKGDDLAKIAAFADAWEAADKGGAHEGNPAYQGPADDDDD